MMVYMTAMMSDNSMVVSSVLLKAVYLAHYLAVTMEYFLVEDLVAMMVGSMDCLLADYLVPE